MENDRSMQRRKLHTQNKGAEDRTREKKQQPRCVVKDKSKGEYIGMDERN